MKITFICATARSVVLFRKDLIKTLQDKGCEVSVIAFHNESAEEIEKLGVQYYPLQGANRSANPFKMLSLKKRYFQILTEIQPDVVFTFMLKPNTFGVLAAKKAGVKRIYSMVEGIGDAFLNDTLKWKIIRSLSCSLYRKSFQYAQKVFFLNQDDQAEFLSRKLVKASQCELVHGVGVDLTRFTYKPMQNHATFLMVARMLKTKGVLEYCEASREVKKKYPNSRCLYVGSQDGLTTADIQSYIDDGSVEYLGEQKDVRPYLEECTVHVLPTHGEGFGLVNAEAGAIGRPSITCNVNGARDTVVDGYNGFLIEKGDVRTLVEKMCWCIEHPQETEQMGKNSRLMTENKFDRKKINQTICQVLGIE